MSEKKTGKTALKRERQRAALIEAGEKTIAAKGFGGLKARELADEIGIALGQIYNLVSDLDELVLRVSSNTLRSLEEAIAGALQKEQPQTPEDELVVIARTYHHFARCNYHLWRTLFDHRPADGKDLPEWVSQDRMRPFVSVEKPLGQLMQDRPTQEIRLFSQTIFSAVHGMVSIGLDSRDVGVPRDQLDQQIGYFIHVICRGIQQ